MRRHWLDWANYLHCWLDLRTTKWQSLLLTMSSQLQCWARLNPLHPLHHLLFRLLSYEFVSDELLYEFVR